MNENILDAQDFEKSSLRRRDLLPIWIKVFIWIFMIFGVISPIIFVLGLFGTRLELAFYGLQTWQALSLVGILIVGIFVLKGIVAYGLWTEQKWAVNLAIIDATIGIIICVVVMLILPAVNVSGGYYSGGFRVELLPLYFCLRHMNRIKEEWNKRNP